ncbi:MAG: hypothetical protein OQL08_01665 [Gammaproteobacteria bacterium]|nr:hypothetical protein [Gammaproteobacteria bacterium]
MKTRLIDFFRMNAPDRDPEELASSVLGVVEHEKKADAAKRREEEAINKALRKISQAITELEKVDGQRVKHLLNNLRHAQYEAGDPSKNYMVKSRYISIPGPDFNSPRVIASEVKPRAKNAKLIFALEGFWLRTFRERPSEWRDHKFFELAAIVCSGTKDRDANADSLYQQRKRVAKPLAPDGNKGNK